MFCSHTDSYFLTYRFPILESQNKVKMCILNKRHIWVQGEVLKVINPFRSGKGEERAEGRKKNPDGPAHLWSGGIYTCQLFRLLTLSQTKKNIYILFMFNFYLLFIDIPKVRLELGRNLEGESIREGIDVYFDCHVTARPSAVRLIWRHQVCYVCLFFFKI